MEICRECCRGCFPLVFTFEYIKMFLSCGLQEVHILRVKMHNKRLSTDLLLATDFKRMRKDWSD